ncbi:MAG: aldo/keto reductase [Firmicutes bacterium]|nr:aldo/keto reductase [Bacillota bacterium]
MEYRILGNTGLKVSVIGMGCEGFSEEDHDMTKKLFDAAERLGINYFDLYASNPETRRAVGEALKGRREKFVIQSHICSVWKDGQYLRSRNLDEVKAGFEEMMALLDVDYLDVGMIHYCDAMKDWEELVANGVLDYARELKASGRIKHIGLSSHNPLVAERAVKEGGIEVLMFSVNPCYDLQPASEDVEDLWADETYSNTYTNLDPDRERLYETCQGKGVGITVMKAFGGGDLLSAELSPAGVALTANQCISYALSRPGVCVVLAGAHNAFELEESAAYCNATEEEKDYATAFESFPRVSWEGHCMYCNHCAPCREYIDIAMVNKFLNLAKAQGVKVGDETTYGLIPETVREHYKVLDHHAIECVKCGACEMRCPFGVKIRADMDEAVQVFGY